MNRLLFRLLYYPLCVLLKVVNVVKPRIYMKWFVQLLKMFGMNFNGMPRYISSDAYFDNLSAITLSERTVISKQCVFLTHDYSPTTAFLSSPPLTNKELVKTDAKLDGKIIVHENVFIGLRVTILPNTIIEKNCIIGAGAVIKGHVPEGSVVAGNPAKILCTMQEYKNKCMMKMDKMVWD